MNRGKDYEIRSFEPGDEVEVVKLVTSTFHGYSKDLWAWKYIENPDFDESLVFVARNNGRIIGCMHYLPRELKIARSVKVNGALGADFAVYPDYRGQGIGSSMLRFCADSKALEKKGIVVTFGFTDLGRESFYRRNIATVALPVSTVTYRKYFDAGPLQQKLKLPERFGGEKGTNIHVLFQLSGFPHFTLRIEDGRAIFGEEVSTKPDVIVKGDPYLLEDVYEGRKGFLDLAIGILRRKIKIEGSITGVLNLFKIVREIRKLPGESPKS